MTTSFKYRNKEYRLERDAHQFILSQKTGKEYVNIGYYSDPYYLIQKLVSLHLCTLKEGKEMAQTIHTTCKALSRLLSNVLPKAEKASDSSAAQRSVFE